MFKKLMPIFVISLSILLLPSSPALAESDGIPLQKDVILGEPIFGAADLPDEVTFTLYDSQTAIAPIGTQTFARGEYTVDFEFSQSDGITAGDVARVTANFTNKLTIDSDPESATKTEEIWVGVEVAGTEIGDRTKVSDGTLVQLLLASDASIATYLTLVYEGDDNPITTIYKDLPISSLSPDGSGSSLSSYFGSLAATGSDPIIEAQVAGSDGQIQYNDGGAEGGASQFYYDDVNDRLGLGTSAPTYKFHCVGSQYIYGNQHVNSGILEIMSNTGYRLRTDNTGTAGDLQIQDRGSGTVHLLIKRSNGNVGIGAADPTYKLSVNGSVGCKELTVTNTGWADFVFKDDYKLASLKEVDAFIQENKHLPGIPTEAEVKEKGVNVGDISSKLLQKIEELTLYVIDLKKENDSLRAQVSTIQSQLNSVNQ